MSARDPGLAIAVSREIEAPPDALWRLLSTPGGVARWHPFLVRNPCERWDGVGSRDTLHYYSGTVIHRTIHRWIDGVGFDLEAVHPLGLRSATVEWRIDERGPARSRLNIALAPYIVRRVPGWARATYMRRIIAPPVSRYLWHVLEGINHTVTTGQAVRRNQFGSHLWFSPWTPWG